MTRSHTLPYSPGMVCATVRGARTITCSETVP
jgi:hypothetical protein